MPAQQGYTAFRAPPISNEASGINKFVDLRQRTRDLKARYLPRYYVSKPEIDYYYGQTWDYGLGEPCYVTLSVKPGNFVALYAKATMNGVCQAGIVDDIDFPTGASAMWNPITGAQTTMCTAASVYGTTWPNGSWWTFRATPGIHTYYLAHRENPVWGTATGNGFIKDRILWGMVL